MYGCDQLLWHSHWNHQLAVGGGQLHTVTSIMSFCLQRNCTEKLSAMVLATPQQNKWMIELKRSAVSPWLHVRVSRKHTSTAPTQDMHIQSHQEKKWGCYFSHVSSFKQQGLRGEREILSITAWFPVASTWSCSKFRTSCTYSISQSSLWSNWQLSELLDARKWWANSDQWVPIPNWLCITKQGFSKN